MQELVRRSGVEGRFGDEQVVFFVGYYTRERIRTGRRVKRLLHTHERDPKLLKYTTARISMFLG